MAGDDCRCRQEIMSAPNKNLQIPPSAVQDSTGLANQMDVERQGRAQADAASRLSAIYLWSGAGLINPAHAKQWEGRQTRTCFNC